MAGARHVAAAGGPRSAAAPADTWGRRAAGQAEYSRIEAAHVRARDAARAAEEARECERREHMQEGRPPPPSPY